jgi:hypothetical protein
VLPSIDTKNISQFPALARRRTKGENSPYYRELVFLKKS